MFVCLFVSSLVVVAEPVAVGVVDVAAVVASVVAAVVVDAVVVVVVALTACCHHSFECSRF